MKPPVWGVTLIQVGMAPRPIFIGKAPLRVNGDRVGVGRARDSLVSAGRIWPLQITQIGQIIKCRSALYGTPMLPELHIDADRDRFLQEYYLREQPVLFRNAARAEGTAESICHLLNDRIAGDRTVTERIMWYDVREKLLDEICGTPPAIARLMNTDEAFLRDNCVRIWFNPKGHVTPWHYDGHSLHVFNLQLKGRKHWTIVAPDTPLTCMPFNNTCLFNEYSLAGKRYYEFVLEEGDMIFLPRFWFHHVISQDAMNVNVNWVLMPKRKPVESKIGRREMEIMWLKEKFYPVMPPKSRWLVNHYAGGGREAVRCLTQHVSAAGGLSRLAKESAMLPMFLLLLPAQARKLITLRRSKRLMRELMAAEAKAPAQAA